MKIISVENQFYRARKPIQKKSSSNPVPLERARDFQLYYAATLVTSFLLLITYKITRHNN